MVQRAGSSGAGHFSWGAEFLSAQAIVVQMGENSGKRASFPLVFLSCTGARARLSHQHAPAKAGSCNRWRRRFPVELRKLQIRIALRGEPQVVHAMRRRQL